MADVRMYKYPLFNVHAAVFDDTVSVRTHVPVPKGAQHIAMQGGTVTLWSMVDADSGQVTRTFLMVGTGQRLPERYLAYMGTVFERGFVWHLFEIFPEVAG